MADLDRAEELLSELAPLLALRNQSAGSDERCMPWQQFKRAAADFIRVHGDSLRAALRAQRGGKVGTQSSADQHFSRVASKGHVPHSPENQLAKDLHDALVLLTHATPGHLEVHTSCSWRRIMADDAPFIVPTVDRDGHPNMDKHDNIEAAAAAVNFLRKHAAKLASVFPLKPIRFFVNGEEVSRDDAFFAWRSSDTYRNAQNRYAIWRSVEDGTADEAALNHLREAGVTVLHRDGE